MCALILVESMHNLVNGLRSDMNMKVPIHFKKFGLRKKSVDGFVFGVRNIGERKRGSGRSVCRGKKISYLVMEKERVLGTHGRPVRGWDKLWTM